ncbi:F-actin-capping protein subunit alpha [Globomyces pollinis-pini]|nr:F-actin-capping protein subunit alpha [Globomyces pollinis-pini]
MSDSIQHQFILDSPPGQITDVYNDIVAIAPVDLTPAFHDHNLLQFIPVELPDKDYKIVLSEHTVVDDVLIDQRTNQGYKVNHLTLAVSKDDVVPDSLPQDRLDYRSSLDKAITDYTASHYPNGVSTVHATSDNFHMYIVDNKYNSNNFWAGRWRSYWHITPDWKLVGLVRVHVHYYEDGNVQLFTDKEYNFSLDSALPPAQLATAVINHITKAESQYQTSINHSFNDTAVNTFKSLRRALPLTRTKIDWPAIVNYRVGGELASK